MNFRRLKQFAQHCGRSLVRSGTLVVPVSVFSTVFFICPNQNCCSVNKTECEYFPFYTKCGNQNCHCTLFVDSRQKSFEQWFDHSMLSLSKQSLSDMFDINFENSKKRFESLKSEINKEVTTLKEKMPNMPHMPDIDSYIPENINNIIKNYNINMENINFGFDSMFEEYNVSSLESLYNKFKVIKHSEKGTMWLLPPGWSIFGGYNENIDTVFAHFTSLAIPLVLALGAFDAQRTYLITLALNTSSLSPSVIHERLLKTRKDENNDRDKTSDTTNNNNNTNNNSDATNEGKNEIDAIASDLDETVAQLQSARDTILNISNNLIKHENVDSHGRARSDENFVLSLNGIEYPCIGNKIDTKNEILEMMNDLQFDAKYGQIIARLYDGWSQNRQDNECTIGHWLHFVATLEINGWAMSQDFGSGYMATGTKIVCHKCTSF